MYDPESYRTTKRLLRDLNLFMVHVLLYFAANILLILYAFRNIGENWWMMFPVILWSVFLIYHGIYIYTNRKNDKVRSFLSFLLPM